MSTDNKGNAALDAKVNLDGIEDVEILKAKVQEERDARIADAEAKRQLTARAKAAEDKLKEAPETITKKDDQKPYDILNDDTAALLMQGYKVEDVKFIMANGGRKTLEDKNSYVSVAINAVREQRKAEDAASKTNDSTGGDAIFKTHTFEQLKNMSAKELEKILPKTY